VPPRADAALREILHVIRQRAETFLAAGECLAAQRGEKTFPGDSRGRHAAGGFQQRRH
jgi:ribosomal protein L27